MERREFVSAALVSVVAFQKRTNAVGLRVATPTGAANNGIVQQDGSVEIELRYAESPAGDRGIVAATCKMQGRPFELEFLEQGLKWSLASLSLVDWIRRKPLLPAAEMEVSWKVVELPDTFTGELQNFLRTDTTVLLRIKRTVA